MSLAITGLFKKYFTNEAANMGLTIIANLQNVTVPELVKRSAVYLDGKHITDEVIQGLAKLPYLAFLGIEGKAPELKALFEKPKATQGKWLILDRTPEFDISLLNWSEIRVLSLCETGKIVDSKPEKRLNLNLDSLYWHGTPKDMDGAVMASLKLNLKALVIYEAMDNAALIRILEAFGSSKDGLKLNEICLSLDNFANDTDDKLIKALKTIADNKYLEGHKHRDYIRLRLNVHMHESEKQKGEKLLYKLHKIFPAWDIWNSFITENYGQFSVSMIPRLRKTAKNQLIW